MSMGGAGQRAMAARGQLGMRHLSAVLRGAGIVLLTLLAALPWGLPADLHFVPPLLPLVAICAANLRQAGSCPEWLAFACGLLLDIAAQGPLGFWAFLGLLAQGLGVAGGALAARGAAMRLAVLASALVVVAVAGWVLSSLYFGAPAEAGAWARGVAWALPLAALMAPFCIPQPAARRDNARLERGA